MNLSRLSLIVTLTLFVWLLSEPAYSLSIRELLGLDTKETAQAEKTDTKKTATQVQTAENVSEDTKPTANTGKKSELSLDEIQKIISILDDNQRKTLLTDEKSFQKFVEQEAGNKSVLSAAIANKIDQNEKTKYLTQRGTENILREYYLNQLINSKIPADFPTEQQIKEYYDNNKDKFSLGERVYIWQIFLAITDKMSKKEIELLKKNAETITNDLNKGKLDFGTAARLHSDHNASKYTGGYMGLVNVSDLKPEIQKPLMALDEGKLSKPITSEIGIHILKRGTIIPEQPLQLEEVHDQIKQLLQTQIRTKLRAAIYDQAKKTYPVDLDNKKIEEWRLKLRTNSQSSAVTTAN